MFHISYSATLNTASGTGLTSPTEVLGEHADTSNWLVRSQNSQAAYSNIQAGAINTEKMTWVSINKNDDNSEGWVDSNRVGCYIVHSTSNASTDPGDDAIIQLTVEYHGADI